MKVKLIAAAVLAAGLVFGAGGTSNEAQAGVNFYFGVGPGYYGPGYYGYGNPYYYGHRHRFHRHRHCHRVKAWRNGHRVWVRRCHSHRHGPGHHR